MFQNLQVAKRIREARISRNMTQMNLADAMGVSYQAVSNWERGNSLPDISKLEDLCRILGTTVSDLLGVEKPETATVVKVMGGNEEPLSEKELVDIAPLLPPEELRQQTQKAAGCAGNKINLSSIAAIAPFLDEAYLEELVKTAKVESLAEVVSLAPFLSEDAMDALVKSAKVEGLAEVVPLAPFLTEDALDALVKSAKAESLTEIVPLAPFLSEDTLDAVVDRCIAKGNVRSLSPIYCFLREDSLHKIVQALLCAGDTEEVCHVAHFL